MHRHVSPYPLLRSPEDTDAIVDRSLERFGTTPTDDEILGNLVYGGDGSVDPSRREIAMPPTASRTSATPRDWSRRRSARTLTAWPTAWPIRGEAVAKPEFGDVKSAGGPTHKSLLLDAQRALSRQGIFVEIIEQRAAEQPDSDHSHVAASRWYYWMNMWLNAMQQANAPMRSSRFRMSS